MKSFISRFKNSVFNLTYRRSYSQEGEDLILDRIFDGKREGYYVDIGAFHPVRFSNTYLFYRRGWSGITIDARPGSSGLFKKIRPRDISIEQPVNDERVDLTYYMFDEPALNGFSKEITNQRISQTSYKLIKEITLHTETLSNILEKHLPISTKIDFVSIDVEGLDLNVLRSNNWEKFRPLYILTEDLNLDPKNIYKSPVSEFLYSKGYSFFAKTLNTVFFKNDLS
jgi:FkbM family methyltransferase